MFTMTGKLLRITTFTANGTWTKKDDVGSILIKAVGAGGTSNATGGSSSIAGVVANGGGVPSTINSEKVYANGGSASGGDINIPGLPYLWRYRPSASSPVAFYRGISALAGIGNGSVSDIGSGNTITHGGGGGGYAEKFISNPSASYPVVVGQHSGDTSRESSSGIVIIYEFAK